MSDDDRSDPFPGIQFLEVSPNLGGIFHLEAKSQTREH
jgi:hypothetical protein